MVELIYPATLPGPQTSAVAPSERRQLDDAQRPREVRALQRDRLEFERLTFPPFDAVQAAAFRAWWTDDLYNGGAWFAATWPLPRGLTAAVRRFVGAPQWDFVPGGYWRISALCEVRGRGELPTAPVVWIEPFDEGLTPYTANAGSGTLGALTIVSSPTWEGAQAFQLAQINELNNRFYQRDVPDVVARNFEFFFYLLAYGTDDALAVQLIGGGQNVVTVNCSREPGLDGGIGRVRGFFGPSSSPAALSTARPALGAWHRVRIVFSEAANATTYEVRRMDTNAVVGSGTVSGTFAPTAVDTLVLAADCSPGFTTTATVVDYIRLEE